MGQLDKIRRLEVGLGLLLVMAVLMANVIAPAATADDIAPLMTGFGNARLVVFFVDLQFGKHLPCSPQSYLIQSYECVGLC
jgi:hypothetical protein